MTCDGCAAAIRRAIGRVDQAARVEIDVPTGWVDVDGTAEPGTLAKAIEAAGFGVAQGDRP
jgi:copper chaperone